MLQFDLVCIAHPFVVDRTEASPKNRANRLCIVTRLCAAIVISSSASRPVVAVVVATVCVALALEHAHQCKHYYYWA